MHVYVTSGQLVLCVCAWYC